MIGFRQWVKPLLQLVAEVDFSGITMDLEVVEEIVVVGVTIVTLGTEVVTVTTIIVTATVVVAEVIIEEVEVAEVP